MFSRASVERFLLKVWGNQFFLILLIVNILCNFTAVVTFGDKLSMFLIVCISALSATVESCICRIFRNSAVRKCLLWLFVALHLIIAIVDVFLIINFEMIWTGGTVAILAETTPSESISFLSTYLGLPSLLAFILGIGLFILLVVWISRKLKNNRLLSLLSMLLSVFGLMVYMHMVYMHVVSGEGGLAVSQLHSFTRVAYSVMDFRGSHSSIESMRETNRTLEASLMHDDAPSVIVILGESFSLYHSSLYGYSKMTYPLLSARLNDSSLCVFDNVVSPSDHTGIAMSFIYSANGSNEPNDRDVMFPSCFRKAGYKTALIDNQYFIGNGYTWITDNGLSEIMFDYRNQHEVGHDANLLKEIPNFADPQLIVIHLIGQHYTYADRYPSEFKHFTAADYSSALTEDEREMLAHYDNASLYNDYVVESIIRKFQDKNCLVVYFSDHGEELYEIDDFMGHGNAAQRPTIDYQIRIPFMVWTSPQFQSKYPDVAKRIKESVHKPIITDYLAQFLFEAAGIDTKYYCPELSFINEKYPADISRIVLDNIDFDHRAKQEPIKTRY